MSQNIAGYMTPEEFANLIVVSLEASNYFGRKEKVHPQDLVVAFVAQAEAVALGAGFSIMQENKQKKNAILVPTDLSKADSDFGWAEGSGDDLKEENPNQYSFKWSEHGRGID